MASLIEYVDLTQTSFWISALTIFGAPLGWNILGRVEYNTRCFTRLFGSKFRGCYAIALYIYCFSFYRNLSYNWALYDQPMIQVDNFYLEIFIKLIAYILYFCGFILVVSSSWALGILGTYNGDYFRILMEERITAFPFSILSNPMYVGSTALFFARAINFHSPAGIILSIWAALIYKIGTMFEEPFTSYIYSQAAEKAKRKEHLEDNTTLPADSIILQKDILTWTVDEVVEWLEAKGFTKYKQTFIDHHIDGSILLRLDMPMLLNDLQVSSLGHRFKIIDLIKQEKERHENDVERSKGNKWISERKAIEESVMQLLDDNLLSNIRKQIKQAEQLSQKLLGKNKKLARPTRKLFWSFKKEQ